MNGTDYILAEFLEYDSAERIRDNLLELKKRGILVRHFNAERIRDYNRITVGTPQQMEKLVEAIKEILEERT